MILQAQDDPGARRLGNMIYQRGVNDGFIDIVVKVSSNDQVSSLLKCSLLMVIVFGSNLLHICLVEELDYCVASGYMVSC